MLAPHTISEKMRMNVMEGNTSDCVPEPVSPKVWEMIIAMAKLRTAASILVPKVFRIFLNTVPRFIHRKNNNYSLDFQIRPLQLSLSAPVTEAKTLVFPSILNNPRKAKTKASL